MTRYSPPVNSEIEPSALITACIVASRKTDTETLMTVSTVRRLLRADVLNDEPQELHRRLLTC